MHKRKYQCGADKRKAEQKELKKCVNDQQQKNFVSFHIRMLRPLLILSNVPSAGGFSDIPFYTRKCPWFAKHLSQKS